MSDSIFSDKKKYAKILKEYYHFETKNKPTGLIILNNPSLIEGLLDGLEVLWCDFIVKTSHEFLIKDNVLRIQDIKKDLVLWFDFLVWDNDSEWLQDFFNSGVVPILPSNYHLSSILREFDPLQSEWNCFLYQNQNQWSVYHAIIRYLENYKFPYDNRNLVKNIIKM